MAISSAASKISVLKLQEASDSFSSPASLSSSLPLRRLSLENQQIGQSLSSRPLAKRATINPDVDSLSKHFGRLEIPSGREKKQRTQQRTNDHVSFAFVDLPISCQTQENGPTAKRSIVTSLTITNREKKQRTLKFETEPTTEILVSEETEACSSSVSSSSSQPSTSKRKKRLLTEEDCEKKQRTLKFETGSTLVVSSSKKTTAASSSSATASAPADLLAHAARKKMRDQHYSEAKADFQKALQCYLSEKNLCSPQPTTTFSSCSLSDYVPPRVLKGAGFTYFKLNEFEASSRFYAQAVMAYEKRQERCPAQVFAMAGLSQLEAGMIENANDYFEKAAQQPLLVPGWIWARAAHRFLEIHCYAEVCGFSAKAQDSYRIQKKTVPLEHWEVAVTGTIKLGGLTTTIIELVEKGLFAFRCAGKNPPQSLFLAGIHAYLSTGDLEQALKLSNLSVQQL